MRALTFVVLGVRLLFPLLLRHVLFFLAIRARIIVRCPTLSVVVSSSFCYLSFFPGSVYVPLDTYLRRFLLFLIMSILCLCVFAYSVLCLSSSSSRHLFNLSRCPPFLVKCIFLARCLLPTIVRLSLLCSSYIHSNRYVSLSLHSLWLSIAIFLAILICR